MSKMSRRGEGMKYLPNESELKTIQALKRDYLIVGFTNRFDEEWVGSIRKIGVGKDKGKFNFFTLISIGKDLTLKDLGYKDSWSKKQKYFQTNMEFIMTKKNMIELRDELNKKLEKKQLKDEVRE